ncbi:MULTISPECIES: P27 family phage terminase small subunit [unclassified Bradyrhizobium]
MASPRAPDHLSRTAKTWWRQVHADFELDDHHRHLLRLACESLDQSEESRAAIAEHGAVVLDRFGCQKPSPWVDIQHKSQNRFRILCRELGLDVQSADGPRMPRDLSYGNRR